MGMIAMVSVMGWGSFIPSFGSDGKGVDDKNFVRDNNQSIVIDKKEKKSYSDINNTKTYSFQEAIGYCENLTLANSSDWRLPSKDELRSLFDFRHKPVRIKNSFLNTQEGRYWSSTKASQNKAYYIGFDLGRYSRDKEDKRYFVMCVRDH